jgi:hypothetical protein
MNEQPFELPFICAPIFFLIVFPAMSLVVSSVLAQLSGWVELARVYRFEGEFQGKRWSLESAMLNSVRYKSCLTVGATPEGMYLRPALIFRFGHQPLFIPWADISVEPANAAFFWHSNLHFAQARHTSLKIGKGLAERLAQAADDRWPAEPPTA